MTNYPVFFVTNKYSKLLYLYLTVFLDKIYFFC